jgi:hypothetical protein
MTLMWALEVLGAMAGIFGVTWLIVRIQTSELRRRGVL